MRRLWQGAAVVAGLVAVVGFTAAQQRDAGWREVRWPFPRDAWPAGRAFRCGSPACGGDVEVYLRAKRGLCANCATGVTDDAEVDGIADLDMISDDFVPAGAGEPVAVGGMAGRRRGYTLRFADGTRRRAVGYLMSRPKQCDLFVVAGQGSGAETSEARAAIGALLVSDSAAPWIDAQLDGR